MHLRRPLSLMLGTALLMSACTDAGTENAVLAPRTDVAPVSEQEAEAAALAQVTRAVALALQDQGLRHRIRNDLRESRFTEEHKLPFSDYLKGASGGILLAKMSRETGMSRADIQALLARVRPLEFYMPVPEHRESWTGGADLLVASLLEDHTVPNGFALNGAPVALHAEVAPETPTLAIVPVETDFTAPLGAQFRNVNDRGGHAIGTWANGSVDGPSFVMAIAPEDGSGGGGGGGGYVATKPAGLYMTYSYITDDGEAWTKGAPELETHVHGQYTGGGTYGKDLSCAGEKMTINYRNYNQDSRTWSGEVLLFSKSEIDAFNAQFSQGFNVMVWEDDDTACTLKTDKDIRGLLQLTAGVAAFVGVVVMPNPTTAAYITGGGSFLASLYQNASWLLSNDDFIGDAVPVSSGSMEHRVMNGTSNKGTIHLVNRYY